MSRWCLKKAQSDLSETFSKELNSLRPLFTPVYSRETIPLTQNFLFQNHIWLKKKFKDADANVNRCTHFCSILTSLPCFNYQFFLHFEELKIFIHLNFIFEQRGDESSCGHAQQAALFRLTAGGRLRGCGCCGTTLPLTARPLRSVWPSKLLSKST